VRRVTHPVSLVSFLSARTFAMTSSTFDIFVSLHRLDRALVIARDAVSHKWKRPRTMCRAVGLASICRTTTRCLQRGISRQVVYSSLLLCVAGVSGSESDQHSYTVRVSRTSALHSRVSAYLDDAPTRRMIAPRNTKTPPVGWRGRGRTEFEEGKGLASR